MGAPRSGGMPLTRIKTRVIREWFDALPYGRTSEKLLTMVGAVFAYAKGEGWIDDDPTAAIRQKPVTYSGEYDFYSTDEVRELVAAADTEQDAAVYLTAAMTGLRRGELMALSWRDVDFKGQAIQVRANYSFGQLVAPKSGKVRTVPMVPEVSDALKTLSQRPILDGPTDPRIHERDGRPPRRSSPSPSIRKRRQGCRATPPAVPLAPTSLRLDGGEPRLARPGPDLDGPLTHSDHRSIPPREEPRGRRRPYWLRRSRTNSSMVAAEPAATMRTTDTARCRWPGPSAPKGPSGRHVEGAPFDDPSRQRRWRQVLPVNGVFRVRLRLTHSRGWGPTDDRCHQAIRRSRPCI